MILGALIATIEVARRLPLLSAANALVAVSARSRAMLLRRGSDRWKERALRALSLRLLQQSLRLGGLLALVVLPICALFVADYVHPFSLTAHLLNWSDRIVLLSLTLLYSFGRYHVAQRLRTR